MRQDKQENNDDVKLVEYNTNYLPFLNIYRSNFCKDNWNITTTNIKDDTTDYEEINKIIYL